MMKKYEKQKARSRKRGGYLSTDHWSPATSRRSIGVSPIMGRMPMPRGFTLIELMVAVGLSEATSDIFAKARAINQQIESDVSGINKSGFLVIRCRAEKVPPASP